jgi:hypothetical protein
MVMKMSFDVKQLVLGKALLWVQRNRKKAGQRPGWVVCLRCEGNRFCLWYRQNPALAIN